ncbi:UDP-glucose-sterol transferase [Penicillium lagena]|uniref:UDP-glucose-sterol transferase n=1 Tax=Penicillium lagena TaxID=94218 RepID=UPI002541A617|nr:UDP-glucose-sterol transferase [Penicillium lagena]KAJ5620027.1 UDP-glucose-sterol transferase [Penicillium lagena]
MAEAAESRKRTQIAADDWQGVQPSRSISSTNDYSNVREEGLSTAVRIRKDGRLDVNFQEHRPWLTTLMKHVERIPEPVTEEHGPLTAVSEGEKKFPLHLNIVIQVVGSRGDIQPFIALGKELRQHGHRVRLATHLAFRNDINGEGLEFFNIGGNPEELMAFMVQNPGLLPGMRTIRSGAIQKRRREMKDIFSGCWRSCVETGDGTGLHHIAHDPHSDAVDNCTRPFVADAIIANPPGFMHLSCAEKLAVSLNMMFTMPWSPTQSFPHPLANVRSQSTKPSVANFASYGIVEVMMWEGLGDLINGCRKKDLGLDPLDAIRAPSMIHHLRVPFTYLWSPSLLPKPHDWPGNIDLCGFQFLSATSDYHPPEDLDAFLKAGEPPIYIGFGSIVVENPDKLTKVILEAARRTGKRTLISKGWSNLGSRESEISDKVFLLGKCPHDWLFPRVSCVIHHGGAGTTAAGLLLGRPTVIVPFFGDQPFWGSIVARAGAGPQPIPYKELTAEKLASAIKEALEVHTQDRANEIGEKMRKEKGTIAAVHSFHQHLNVDLLRCTICPNRPAVWWHRHSHIKLSAFATSVLLNTGHIKPKDLTLYRAKEYDTTRDPRGPLSATAEVLYGLMTDLIGGIARVPGQVAGICLESHSSKSHRDYRGREWAMQHFSNLFDNMERERASQGSADNDHPHNNSGNHHEEDLHVRSDGAAPVSDDAFAGERMTERLATRPSRNATNINTRSNTSEAQTGSTDEKHGTTKETLSDTWYQTTKFTKHATIYALILPTDLTLSLSKGFHNAPKLYNDTTVEPIPRVTGIRTGFRAAGTELHQGFYHGVTGLALQPAQGYQQSKSKGLATGIGKGFLGAFFKPTAGVWGLVGYPLDGVHKHLRKSLGKAKSKEIIQSRITQGVEEMFAASTEEQNMVIHTWHGLQNSNHSRRNLK